MPDSGARGNPRAPRMIQHAIKAALLNLQGMLSDEKTSYAGPPLEHGHKVYLETWVLPKLEAALEAAEGGRAVPEWAQRRP